MTTLGQRLLAMRLYKALSLRQAEELSGVSPSAISRLERDVDGDTYLSSVIALAKAYGTTVGSLLGEGEPVAIPTTGRLVTALKVLEALNEHDLCNGTREERSLSIVLSAVELASITAELPQLAYAIGQWMEPRTVKAREQMRHDSIHRVADSADLDTVMAAGDFGGREG